MDIALRKLMLVTIGVETNYTVGILVSEKTKRRKIERPVMKNK